MPGFVDPHTHPVFAGSREREVEWKSQGLTYSEIAARGGGILQTVRATRDATEAALAQDGADRLRGMAAFGTTTVEAKSGYGLRTVDELKILRAIAGAGRIAGLDVVPTFLGAHAIPSEFDGRPEAYVDLVAGEMLEAVLSDRLASFCDVFVDGGYFSVDQARRILTKARDAGLLPKVHADELSDAGGSALAAEMRAASADHLNHASVEGVEAMSREGVVAVLLPATSLASHLPFADGRRLVAAGVPVAIGTDFNPNTWCESMQLAIALACHHNGLLPAEAITAATINAACAIGRERAVPDDAIAGDDAVHDLRRGSDRAALEDDALLRDRVRLEARSVVQTGVVRDAPLPQEHSRSDVTGAAYGDPLLETSGLIEDHGALAGHVLPMQRLALPGHDRHARLPQVVRLSDVHPDAVDLRAVQPQTFGHEFREQVLREVELLLGWDELQDLRFQDVDARVHDVRD